MFNDYFIQQYTTTETDCELLPTLKTSASPLSDFSILDEKIFECYSIIGSK